MHIPKHVSLAMALQRQSGKGAAECGWFLALRFLTPSFLEKDGNRPSKKDGKPPLKQLKKGETKITNATT